jgi:hypothetical protein
MIISNGGKEGGGEYGGGEYGGGGEYEKCAGCG